MNTLLSRAVLLATCCTATAAFADSVTGQFALEGKEPLKPTRVAAFRLSESKTLVMLTTKALDRQDIAKSDPEFAAINDPAVRHADFMEIFVSKSGTVSVAVTFGGVQYVDSSKMDLVASCTNNTAERVTCTAKTAKPVKPMSGPGWSLDVAFDSAITPPGK